MRRSRPGQEGEAVPLAKSLLPLLLAGAALGACNHGSSTDARTELPPDRRAEAVALAVADPLRADHRATDARRKPSDLVLFAGVQPGDRVLDLIPGDGYFTRIFSKIVGPQGKVYGVWPEAYAKLARGNVATLRALSGSKDYANIAALVEPTGSLSAPEPLDVVWTSQNYHDYADEFMGRIGPAVLNKAAYAMLRPGGVYIVIDHAAAAGSGMSATETLHRIDPATVKQQVTEAGCEFVGEDAALRNLADPHDVSVFDPAIRGHTDQFAYKFRKPAA
jgi:predicted methyltransferase